MHKIVSFLTQLTKKKKPSYINSSFSKTDSAIYDLSKNKAVGFFTGSPYIQTASYDNRNGGSFSFNNTMWIQFPHSDNLTPGFGSFTVIAWINTNPAAGGDGWDLWVSKRDTTGRNGYFLGVNSSLGARFMVSNVNLDRTDTPSIPYTSNTWAMFTGVLDRGSNIQRVIRNNFAAQSSITPVSGEINHPPVSLTVGGDVREDSSSAFMTNGRIASVFMYKRALKDDEISNIFNRTRGRFGV
jgi:hypothetical protein